MQMKQAYLRFRPVESSQSPAQMPQAYRRKFVYRPRHGGLGVDDGAPAERYGQCTVSSTLFDCRSVVSITDGSP